MINHPAEQLQRYNDVVYRLSKKLTSSELNSAIEKARAEAAIMLIAMNPDLQAGWWNECCERLEQLARLEP